MQWSFCCECFAGPGIAVVRFRSFTIVRSRVDTAVSRWSNWHTGMRCCNMVVCCMMPGRATSAVAAAWCGGCGCFHAERMKILVDSSPFRRSLQRMSWNFGVVEAVFASKRSAVYALAWLPFPFGFLWPFALFENLSL